MAELAYITPLEELPPIDPEADARILPELGPAVVPLINRHINPERFKDPETRDEFPTVTTYMGENSDLWTPAMYVPWSAGENFPPDYQWTEADSPLASAARSALLLGLLTEDALPWYSEAILRNFGSEEGLNFYARIWTGEEGCHSEAIEGYSIVGRLLDPIQTKRDSIQNIATAQVPDPPSAIESLIYVAQQELATRLAHMNTGRLIADTARRDAAVVALSEDGTTLANVEPVAVHKLDPVQRAAYLRQVARAIMTRIAGDENKHYVFYRDAVGGVKPKGNLPELNGALQIDPSTTVKAIERQVRTFQMPGTGIREFWHHAAIVAEAGVYDMRIHRDKVLVPILGHWGLESVQGLDDEAERARERTFTHMDNLEKIASEFEEAREERRAALVDDPDAIWVGKKAA